MSRFATVLLIAGSLAWAGCDSNEEENGNGNDDADRLVGTWNATAVKAGPIDVLDVVDISLTLVLEANGQGHIDATESNGDVSTVTGSYTVDVELKTITLDGDDIEEDLVMDYDLVDDNTLELEFPGSDLANLGFDLGSAGDIIAGLTIHADLARATG